MKENYDYPKLGEWMYDTMKVLGQNVKTLKAESRLWNNLRENVLKGKTCR